MIPPIVAVRTWVVFSPSVGFGVLFVMTLMSTTMSISTVTVPSAAARMIATQSTARNRCPPLPLISGRVRGADRARVGQPLPRQVRVLLRVVQRHRRRLRAPAAVRIGEHVRVVDLGPHEFLALGGGAGDDLVHLLV